MFDTEQGVLETVLPSGMFFRFREPNFVDILQFIPGDPRDLIQRMVSHCGLFDDNKLTVEQVNALSAQDAIGVISAVRPTLLRLASAMRESL